MVHTLIPSICLLTEHFHINTLTSVVADNACFGATFIINVTADNKSNQGR